MALLCACAAAPVSAQQPHPGPGGGGPGPDHRVGPVDPAAPATGTTATGLVPLVNSGSHAMPSYLGAPFGSPSQRYQSVPSRGEADASADAAARRNGRMSDSERRELRQNIEDAGRDVYRPKP